LNGFLKFDGKMALIKFMGLAAIEAMGDDCTVINFFWAV
jgi:hypothetical protein